MAMGTDSFKDDSVKDDRPADDAAAVADVDPRLTAADSEAALAREDEVIREDGSHKDVIEMPSIDKHGDATHGVDALVLGSRPEDVETTDARIEAPGDVETR